MSTDPKLQSRAVTVDLIRQVLESRHAFDGVADHHQQLRALPERDRAFARNLATTIFRRLGQIDALIDHCLERPLPRRARGVRHILRIGVCQMFFTHVADHAAVSTTVDLARALGHTAHAKLVNAILRHLSREGAGLVAAQDQARLNVPDWLWRSWQAAYGEPACRAIAAAHLNGATLDLSPMDAAVDQVADWAAKMGGTPLPMATVRLPTGGRITDLPGFEDGTWWVQDAAARLVAGLVGDIAGQSVIDLCAAPGGKTAYFLAHGADVTAVDRSSTRLARLRENLRRLRLKANVITANGETWRPDQPADVVFVDAPCSATGTARRHPEVLWIKSAKDVLAACRAQTRLLAAAAEMVRPGGRLIFATCSLQPEEGRDQVAPFLDAHPTFRLDRIAASEVHGLSDVIDDDGCFRSLPGTMAADGGMDGFFAARFVRE